MPGPASPFVFLDPAVRSPAERPPPPLLAVVIAFMARDARAVKPAVFATPAAPRAARRIQRPIAPAIRVSIAHDQTVVLFMAALGAPILLLCLHDAPLSISQ